MKGIFVEGEMIEWEEKKGGYIMKECFEMGVDEEEGIIEWLKEGNK